MTPAAIEWHERMAARWADRAAELRALPDEASQNRAAGLEWTVAGMQRQLAAAAEPTKVASPIVARPASPDRDRLIRIVASSQPYRCPKLGIMFNDGPLMDAVRARLQARIDGVPYVAAPVSSAGFAIATIVATPPAEVEPFAMGPQLGLFGEAA